MCIPFLLGTIYLLINDCLRLRPCFAGLQAPVPGVTERYAPDISAVSEPRTTSTATTQFARFLHETAFGAYQSDSRRRCYIVILIEGSVR